MKNISKEAFTFSRVELDLTLLTTKNNKLLILADYVPSLPQYCFKDLGISLRG